LLLGRAPPARGLPLLVVKARGRFFVKGLPELGRAELERGALGRAAMKGSGCKISSMWRFGGLTGPKSSSTTGVWRLGATGRLLAVRSLNSGFFHAGLFDAGLAP